MSLNQTLNTFVFVKTSGICFVFIICRHLLRPDATTAPLSGEWLSAFECFLSENIKVQIMNYLMTHGWTISYLICVVCMLDKVFVKGTFTLG